MLGSIPWPCRRPMPISETLCTVHVPRSLFFVCGGNVVTALLTSFGFVVLAEMGDKTQLLAMAFAARFRASTVLWGVFAATVCNHFLAVLTGHYLTVLLPLPVLQIAASVSFLLFGLWTIHGDELRGEDRRFRFAPFWTVAVAFFLAEMGDKTQLATVALAAKYQSMAAVLAGTTAAMLAADAMGIGIGVVLGKKIPARIVQWIAAGIFLLFGLGGLYASVPGGGQKVGALVAATVFVGIAAGILCRKEIRRIFGSRRFRRGASGHSGR